jgi:hypothetical protein
MVYDLARQARTLWPWIAAVLVPPLLLLLTAAIQTVAPMGMLMRDPVSIAELPPYTGALSNVGVLLWCGAAAISTFTALLIRSTRGRTRPAALLLWGACLTLLLMLDDLFTVHEAAAFHLDIPDSVVVGLYAVLAFSYVVAFARDIARTDYLVLLISLGFLAASVVVDAFDPKDSELIYALVGDRYHLVEDGPKLVGISAWLGYYARVCWVEARALIAPL